MGRLLGLVAITAALSAPLAAAEGSGRKARAHPDWYVGENNGVVQVYVGRTRDGLTEIVLELDTMLAYSNARNYPVRLVNGVPLQVDDGEVDYEYRYYRGRIKTPADGAIIAWAGTIASVGEKIDPHDHAALWRTLTASPHKPFRAKLAELPRWGRPNPIKAKGPKGLDKRAKVVGRERPHYSPEEIPEAAADAASPLTGNKDRFYTVMGLATSGYHPESAKALCEVACGRRFMRGARVYAAMGLGNFAHEMPAKLKESVRARLRRALVDEGMEVPDTLIRTLVTWGDAKFVREVGGDKMRGTYVELEVLSAINDKASTARLWQIHLDIPDAKLAVDARYNRRSMIGRALAGRKDKRGIDILISLLPTEGAPGPQYRSNVYLMVANLVGRDFGYGRGNYRRELEEAAPKMTKWWSENRETFRFEDVRPRLPAGSPRDATR